MDSMASCSEEIEVEQVEVVGKIDISTLAGQEGGGIRRVDVLWWVKALGDVKVILVSGRLSVV